jgi:hypothetical protein
MKIRQSADQMVIDNSLAMPVATGIILGLGGATIILLGYLNHLWWLWLLGLALLAIGGLVIVFSKSTHIVLARSGDSSIASKTLFTQSKAQSFALADISAVQLRSSQTQRLSKDADGSQRTDTEVKSIVYLKTADARMLQIGSKTRTLNIGGMIGALIQSVPLKKEAEQVAAFIGVPLQVSDAMNFGGGGTRLG